MDSHLNYKVNGSVLSDAGGRALGKIISTVRSMRNIGYKTFTKMYDAGVRPIHNYGAGVWGQGRYADIDKVYNRAIRYFLGVHPRTPIAGLQGEMGWNSPLLDRQVCLLRYWNKLVTMDDDRLTKKMFNVDYDANISNWCNDLRQLFVSIDMADTFVSRSRCDLHLARQKLHGLLQETWHREVLNKPKLRTHIRFKQNYNCEAYLHTYLSRRQRSLFAQLRLGTLPLKIETGRYTNIPSE